MRMRCPWTGRFFEPVVRGRNVKRFADDAARAEAHKAARQYTEHLIAEGFLTWSEVRRWWEASGKAAPSSYTTREGDQDGRAA